MNGIARFVALSIVLVSIQASAGIFTRIPTKSGNYCKDEVVEFFEDRFPGAKTLDLGAQGNGRNWAFWMKTDICSGYFVFDFSGTEGWDCKMAQYGARARFMKRVWAYGDCKDLMPHDEHAR